MTKLLSSNVWIISNAWIIPVLPLASFIIGGIFLKSPGGKLSAWFATGAILASAFFTYALAWVYFSEGQGAAFVPWSFEWLRFQKHLSVNFGVLIDPISVMLLTVVTTVSSLVHIYSTSYMEGDEGHARFFTYLSLFTFSMLGLVLAPNILQMYVFWELVGVSSFLLIGFYYQKPSAVAASMKAFIVTRFADLGFFIGILILGYFGYQEYSSGAYNFSSNFPVNTQPFDFAFLTNPQVAQKLASMPSVFSGLFNEPLNEPHVVRLSILTLSLILIFMGAAGKSAMFPLHVWLPDAMEGPTPVSALIHAATMVVAGVYLVARLFPVFSTAPAALNVVAHVGLFTSVFAAVIACTQEDLKRVLAFSTLSQLGFMMFSLGLSSLDQPLGYTASMFHLFTHAFFKALLFLGAGAVIHAVHTNNIWELGGLRKKMPITHTTFLIAVLAISGIWPFAGFFSKDEILLTALESGRSVFFITALAVTGLTAFYMSRIYFLTFWGKARSDKAGHAHEAPFRMVFPLVILVIFSAVTGFIPFGDFIYIKSAARHAALDTAAQHATTLNFSVALPATACALFGIASAAWLYGSDLTRSDRVTNFWGAIYRVARNKFYIDEIYLFITRKVIFRFIAAPIAWFDRNVVDGGVNLVGSTTRKTSGWLTLLQTGQVQTYGIWFIIGAVAVFWLYKMSVI